MRRLLQKVRIERGLLDRLRSRTKRNSRAAAKIMEKPVTKPLIVVSRKRIRRRDKPT